jgi:ferredoxin-type protein NapH
MPAITEPRREELPVAAAGRELAPPGAPGAGKAPFSIRYRTALLVLGLVLFLPPLAVVFQPSGDSGFCGSWCPRMFFSWRLGQSAREFFAGFARAWLGVALVLGVLAVTVRSGRWWCSHACPVGGAMELGSRLVPTRLRIDFSQVPAAPVRYGYLAVYLLAPALGVGSLCCNYCNFAAIPRLFGAPFSQADLTYFLRTAGLLNLGLVVALGFFAKGGRAYCNLLCPVGALDALANRLSVRFGRRVRVDADRCTACGACAEVCPTWAIAPGGKARVDPLACIPCRACETVCPEEAIRHARPVA